MSSRKRSPQDAGLEPSQAIEPFYTNKDVAVLHNIVLLAEELLPQLPERERLPTNALFAAYFDILPRVGVNADHDSRYARVLFKIGGLRGTEAIYEKFEEILARMGIEIEFDHGQEEKEQFSIEETDEDVESIEQNVQRPSRSRRRRDSESSAWNIVVPQQQRRRQSSIPSVSKAAAGTGMENVPPHHDPEVSDLQGAQLSSHNDGNMVGSMPKQNIRTWLASSPKKSGRGRDRSQSSDMNLQIRQKSPSIAPSQYGREGSQSVESEDFQSRSEVTAVTSVQEQQTWAAQGLFQRYPFNTTSSSLMQVKASLILQHHISFLAKQQLRNWRDRAVKLRTTNANSDLIASQQDRNALLQLAVETWYNRLLEKRQLAETERFFAHLERRSTRARDLYLMHKAFTHWRNCAYDEVERTSVARRHIIRIRTFNAWRDITAVNELKVRRQVLKKFFSVWRRQNLIVRNSTVTAMEKYEDDLVEKTYRLWVQKGWGIKAAIWFTVGTKQQTLSCWSSIVKRFLANDYLAEEHARSQLLWKIWETWKARLFEMRTREQYAVKFDFHRVHSTTLKKWRSEMRVIPAKLALQTDVRSRLLQHTFEIWFHHTQQERRATAVDHLRILREAWTTWRHRVRLKLLRVRINDRTAKEALYKWILAERSLLAKRNLNRELLRNNLQVWTRRCRSREDTCWAQEQLAHNFAIRNVQSFSLFAWHCRLESQRQCESRASKLYTSTALKGLLSEWSKRTEHLKHIHQWSRDAEFYFLASKTIKQWSGCTESARREKRRSAYIRIRRTMKMNLARGELLSWRQRAQRVLELQAQAQELSQNKDMINAMNALDRWRARTEELGELESLWREKTMRKGFIAWKNRSSAFRYLEVEAIINHQERQQSQAVKNWSLLTLQSRSRSHYATGIREKNIKRTFRRMFSYWLQRTLQRRPIIRTETSERGFSDLLGATARAEAWSEFGEGNDVGEWARVLDGPNVSTPVPGYMNTPSRRMERVSAAAARFASTTPRATLSTPFERQLRAQYPRSLASSGQRPHGRSRLGIGEEFANIAHRGVDN
jgi:protein SFI1